MLFFLTHVQARIQSCCRESFALRKRRGQPDPAAWDWFKAKVARRTFSSL